MKLWHKMGLGTAIALVVLAGLGILAISGLRNTLYPVAPRMPVVVSEPMSNILARLDKVLETKAPTAFQALQPGLSAEEIAKLEQENRVKLREDIKVIYQWHNGSRSATNDASGDFLPGHYFLPLEEALAERPERLLAKATLLERTVYRAVVGHRDSWICIFSDKAGDGYWHDPKRKATDGAVFYNFQEDGEYVFFPSAKNLMAGITKCYEQQIFHIIPGSSPPELDEDFDKAEKVWQEFGSSNQSKPE